MLMAQVERMATAMPMNTAQDREGLAPGSTIHHQRTPPSDSRTRFSIVNRTIRHAHMMGRLQAGSIPAVRKCKPHLK